MNGKHCPLTCCSTIEKIIKSVGNTERPDIGDNKFSFHFKLFLKLTQFLFRLEEICIRHVGNNMNSFLRYLFKDCFADRYR